MAMLNRDKVLARIAMIVPTARAAIQAELDRAVADLVADMKAAAPVNELDRTPGQLRDSIHAYAGKRELSVVVIADARDAKGRMYGVWVEFGHRDKAGKHTQSRPFFFPTYRADKKKIRRRLLAAGRRAAKAAFNDGGGQHG